LEVPLRSNLAKLYIDIGLSERGRTANVKSRAAAEEANMPLFVGAAIAAEGELALTAGEIDEALRLFTAAFELFESQGARREQVEAELHLCEAHLAASRLEEAGRFVERAAERAGALGASDLTARVELLRGRVGIARGESHLALPCLERAAALVRGSMQPPLEAEIEMSLRDATAAQGAETLSEGHGRRSLAIWERIALSLPPNIRDAFWSHPARGTLGRAAREPTAQALAAVPSGHERRLERLLEINKRINSSLETGEVLNRAMDAAIELTGAERGFVILLGDKPEGPDEHTLEVPVARNVDASRVESAELSFSRGIAEHVMKTEQAVATLDALNDSRFQRHLSVHEMRVRSVIAVPIRTPSGVLGALYLDDPSRRAGFDQGDVKVLSAFADQVAIALTNARLHDELEARTRELDAERRRVQELARGQAVEIGRLSKALDVQQRALEHRYDYSNIVGQAPAMMRLFTTLDRVTDSELMVLIEGESGTGKELVARAIHFNGPRKEGPFVTVNCSALPEGLLEAELFGSVRGAYTGADRDREGLFVSANGGTLFLDEIGEMSQSMQVKLLRALQEREVRPVGSTTASTVDARILCATNRSLKDEVERGNFREDLYYRVAVVVVWLPPLRERTEDIPAIAKALLDRSVGVREQPSFEIAPDAIRALLAYPWPGNVRELENVLKRATLFSEDGMIGAKHLDLDGCDSSQLHVPLESFQREEAAQILAALRACRWNVSQASRELNIPRASLYRKMKRYGLQRTRS
jgi:transcriptional regulator with GAF, ATPase, and Fis domain